jgi:hypothetical protein
VFSIAIAWLAVSPATPRYRIQPSGALVLARGLLVILVSTRLAPHPVGAAGPAEPADGQGSICCARASGKGRGLQVRSRRGDRGLNDGARCGGSAPRCGGGRSRRWPLTYCQIRSPRPGPAGLRHALVRRRIRRAAEARYVRYVLRSVVGRELIEACRPVMRSGLCTGSVVTALVHEYLARMSRAGSYRAALVAGPNIVHLLARAPTAPGRRARQVRMCDRVALRESPRASAQGQHPFSDRFQRRTTPPELKFRPDAAAKDEVTSAGIKPCGGWTSECSGTLRVSCTCRTPPAGMGGGSSGPAPQPASSAPTTVYAITDLTWDQIPGRLPEPRQHPRPENGVSPVRDVTPPRSAPGTAAAGSAAFVVARRLLPGSAKPGRVRSGAPGSLVGSC